MPDAADLQALWPVVQAFAAADIEYYIGGSVASNVHGRWRTTSDTDLVAMIRQEHVAPLVAQLSDGYYIDAEMIREAIRNRSSFNVIHNETAQKIDVFVSKMRPFDLSVAARAEMRAVSEDGRFKAPVASREDIILSKLEWYRQGDESSQRQWGDIVDVTKVQMPHLDRAYLDRWARELGVRDLLERAFAEAGL